MKRTRWLALLMIILMMVSLWPVSAMGGCDHQWNAATCYAPKTCSKCGATEGSKAEHRWYAATCFAPKTCSVCNATEGNKADHSWKSATCTAPKTCSVCNATEGSPIGHSWKDATCTTPKTCSRCGAREGSPLGHSWAAATCTTPKTCGVCGAREGSPLGHSWAAATCTIPKTCGVCGATEGSALGHSWKDATCTTPKTCGVCGITEGNAHGHSWKAATCTTPKTCSTCGATEGSPLGHSWKSGKCTVCGTKNASNHTHNWSKATCTSPQICSCGATQGKAAGHTWKSATCTAPKTCSTCGATEGSASGHKWKGNTCTVCGTHRSGGETESKPAAAPEATPKPQQPDTPASKPASKPEREDPAQSGTPSVPAAKPEPYRKNRPSKGYKLNAEEMGTLWQNLVRLGYLHPQYVELDPQEYLDGGLPIEATDAIRLFEQDQGLEENINPDLVMVRLAEAVPETDHIPLVRRGTRALKILGYLPEDFDLSTSIGPDGYTPTVQVDDAALAAKRDFGMETAVGFPDAFVETIEERAFAHYAYNGNGTGMTKLQNWDLWNKLILLGYLDESYYDLEPEEGTQPEDVAVAIGLFQQDMGLPVTGEADATLLKLIETVSPNDEIPLMRQIARELKKLGYLPPRYDMANLIDAEGQPDGVFVQMAAAAKADMGLEHIEGFPMEFLIELINYGK